MISVKALIHYAQFLLLKEKRLLRLSYPLIYLLMTNMFAVMFIINRILHGIPENDISILYFSYPFFIGMFIMLSISITSEGRLFKQNTPYFYAPKQQVFLESILKLVSYLIIYVVCIGVYYVVWTLFLIGITDSTALLNLAVISLLKLILIIPLIIFGQIYLYKLVTKSIEIVLLFLVFDAYLIICFITQNTPAELIFLPAGFLEYFNYLSNFALIILFILKAILNIVYQFLLKSNHQYTHTVSTEVK